MEPDMYDATRPNRKTPSGQTHQKSDSLHGKNVVACVGALASSERGLKITCDITGCFAVGLYRYESYQPTFIREKQNDS